MAEDNVKSRRPRVAVVANVYKTRLHTQHIVDRILDGYGYGGVFRKPSLDVVSLYVEQRGEGDLSGERVRRHPGMKAYSNVAQALTQGTDSLSVDGVIYIGEQGDYPRNEKGQTEYPRYRFFEEIVEVFRASHKSVPVYVDKHLSYEWKWARDMYDTSRKMGFPLMAGSSAPVTWRMPSVEMPEGAVVREAVSVAFGALDSYDIHALETIQCMVERRKGGEAGVEWLQTYRGDTFWRAHEQQVWSHALFKAALCRSHTMTPSRHGFSSIYPSLQELKLLAPDAVAYHYQHKDGLRCTMMLLNGLLQDRNFAAAIEGRSQPFSTQMYCSRPLENATLEDYFSPLVYYIEQLMLTGREPYPVERTLLTTGLVCAGIDSLFQGQRRLETPQLAIQYQPAASTMRRT